MACAMRLSDQMDLIITLLHSVALRLVEPAHQPLSSERLAVVAVGRLRARHARARFGRRPAVPAALQADAVGRERRRDDALPALGPGAEGRPRHAHHRRMHPRGARRHDHPHRAARGAADPGRRSALFEEFERRFDREVVQGTARQFVEAKLAERDAAPPPGRRLALPASSPTSRTARAACATCNTLYWIAKYLYRRAGSRDLVEAGLFTPEEYATLPPLRELPVDGALPAALPRPAGPRSA